jgi:hypothetical protein
MKLPEQIRLYLLKVIYNNGNIEPLRLMGYEYTQIIMFINFELEENNAEYINGKLILTKKGNEFLAELENNKKGPGRWIEPEIQSRIAKIEKNDIFLPSQNDLNL